ncbi:MAG: M23 family metallopeptidase [Gammaproteobacteria bacterium]|nr:M23 family metallopeptidase [Gammaproteobacteria bacterium]
MHVFSMSCLAILLFAATSHNALATTDPPRENLVPGGIAVVPISKVHTILTPHVTYNNRRVMVLDGKFIWYAVVGISLAAKPGQHELRIDRADGKIKIKTFTVKPKKYEAQHITLKDKRKVNPYKKDLTRIKKEKKLISSAFQSWRNDVPSETLFTLPVEGRLSSPFGLRRFFNKQARKPHSGIDIAAPKGAPIKAPAGGEILRTGNYFFNGNSVFIDHGQGLVTMYCHMDKIDVKVGQQVKQGEAIGKVGMTGRVTGPHVHWSVSINDTRVDPNLFFPETIETALAKKAKLN